MSAKTILRARPSNIHSHRAPFLHRSFITLPGTESQTLTATRILPYKSANLCTLIADVNSYTDFVPYCIDSKVTKWSTPDANGVKWPAEADLKVGWGGYEEVFTSRLFCVPGSTVEALSGEAVPSIPREDIKHHAATIESPTSANSVFQSLSTRWTFVPFHYKPPTGNPRTDDTTQEAKDRTEVRLAIDFQFTNPIYAALSRAVAPKVAGVMIEAFEARARKVLSQQNR